MTTTAPPAHDTNTAPVDDTAAASGTADSSTDVSAADVSTAESSTTSGTAADSRPVGGADDRVRTALAAAPDQTVTALAEATGLGKSTVAKALTRLESAGHAVRTPGTGAGRARQPDQWNPTPTPDPTPATAPVGDERTGRGRGTGSHRSTGVPRSAKTGQAGRRPPAAAGRHNPKSGTVRLASGGLTQLVADHFAAHPAVPLTSGEAGRALNRSGGAVRNACDKLVSDGVLRLATEKPRRYTTTS